MMFSFEPESLAVFIRRVFAPRPEDRELAIFTDAPETEAEDTPEWKALRRMAFTWAKGLFTVRNQIGLERIDLFVYPRLPHDNAELPLKAYTGEGDPEHLLASRLPEQGIGYPMSEILFDHPLVLALTYRSVTAPLKIFAARYGFRAATLPGFTEAMLPALRVDWDQVAPRLESLKALLDSAEGLMLSFRVENFDYSLFVDLRHRMAHVSDGRIHRPGQVGNLPGGETYIVPYEGEKGEPSRTKGILPVQFGGEVVFYRIEKNRAVSARGEGEIARREAEAIHQEPAYGNVAEIGFGVLGDLGLRPVGGVLLDEKLGLHIAFGRSDHLGGTIGPTDFTRPERVCHVDRIYHPEIADRIVILSADLLFTSGAKQRIMEAGRYTIG